jgi:hypothetical protein
LAAPVTPPAANSSKKDTAAPKESDDDDTKILPRLFFAGEFAILLFYRLIQIHKLA